MSKLFSKEEGEDSDFEIDPCALSSPAEMEGAYGEGDGQPQLADILAPLSGAPLLKEGNIITQYIQLIIQLKIANKLSGFQL